jgi:Tfp pilus assembly protein PilO
MAYEEIRARVLRLAAFALVLGVAAWAALRAADLHRLAGSTAGAAASLHGRNTEARAAAVLLGDSALDDSIRSARERFRSLRVRVPAAGEGMSSESVLRLLRDVGEREGVEVRDYDAVPAVVEGAFEAEGARFCAVGSYDAIGAWIARAVGGSRLVQVREIALDPVPDTLVARAAAPPAPGEAPPSACAVGERPMAVVAAVSFRWYRRAPAVVK